MIYEDLESNVCRSLPRPSGPMRAISVASREILKTFPLDVQSAYKLFVALHLVVFEHFGNIQIYKAYRVFLDVTELTSFEILRL